MRENVIPITHDLDSIRVEQLRSRDIPAEDEVPHDVTWQEYYALRNSVLETLRPFGSVGPMGEALITPDREGPPDPWRVESADPTFFVVDDMLNTWERHIRVEVANPALVDAKVIRSLRNMLAQRHPAWAVGISTKRGYLLVSGNRILARGPAYRGCKTVGDVLARNAGGGQNT